MMYETGGSHTAPERKLALVHRVIMPDKDYPKEYAILVTDRRSIFIRQETKIRFYMVPLGVYFKPRRETQTRQAILRDYAVDALQIFREVLPTTVMFP